MKILFLSHHKWPHIGGVEKHIKEISFRLKSIGYDVVVVSEEDIQQPHKKVVGLIYIWSWLFKNRKLIENVDIVHIHDVFIWYLPFKFLYPSKKVYITFHGWEGKYPIPFWNILNKRIANSMCNGSIAVGKYIEKYYKINSDFVIYGGVDKINNRKMSKVRNSIVYLGRQDKDTGIYEFKKWLNKQSLPLRGKQNDKYKVTYVTNKPNPEKYLETAEYCVPSGYLSYLEAKNYNCKIMTFANNPLKTDYWNEIKLLNIVPTWNEVTDIYKKLWRIKD